MAMTEAGGGDGLFFFSVLNGILKRNVDQHEDGAVERVNAVGKTVFEKYYREIIGNVTKIEKKVHEEYGDSWIIYLQDVAENYAIQIPFSSIQADRFFRRLPNVDLDKKLSMEFGRAGDKPYLLLFQDGERVDYFWTKENPGQLPPMQQLTVKGKLVWDDTDKMNYIERYVDTMIQPKLELMKQASPPVVESAQNVQAPKAEIFPGDPVSNVPDDLPF